MKKQFCWVSAFPIVILAIFILPIVASGQAQDQVQIIRAEFGAGNQLADVTSRVQALVHGEGLNFRVDVDNLLVDPAPHDRKILRLQVRDSSGRMRTLEYPEKSVVRLYVNSGYNPAGGGPYNEGPQSENIEHRGGHGHGLQIIRAEFGAGGRVRDVTARLASMVEGDHLSVRVSSDTMGGDPAQDQRKMLTVWYMYDGRPGQAIANEWETLLLPGTAQSNHYQSHLQIARAQYGAESRFVDVTAQLNSMIQNDALNLTVTNYAMGGDPAPGQRKVLTVFYIFNGYDGRAFANEGDILILPRESGEGDREDDDAYYRRFWPGHSDNELRILQATWGERDRQIDVTGRIASYVRDNRLEMPVSNDAMGGDPAVGATKFLRVIYLWRGLRYEVNAGEGQNLSLP